MGKKNPKVEFGKKSNRKTGDFENIAGRTDDTCVIYTYEWFIFIFSEI